MSSVAPAHGKIHLWDLPVRLTHWLLVFLVLASWITAEERWLYWHRVSGYVLLTLVLFRLYWGFFGSTPARFVNFLRGVRTVVRTFSEKNRAATVGHTPLGGWSVLAMLSILLLQAGLGLFAIDVDGLESGPLATHVSFEGGRQAARLHAIVFNFLLLLIVLHIVAIFSYLLFRREDLITPMLTGRKRAPQAAAPAGYRVNTPWRALLGLALAALVVLALVRNF